MSNPEIGYELTIESSKAFSKLDNEAKRSGKTTGDAFSSQFKSVFLGSFAGNVFASITKKITAGIKSSLSGTIEASSIQQAAVNSLNASLASTGRFTESASKSIQDFASSLQANSKFGDEAILQNAALIQSLGNLEEDGLKRALQASADLASGLGIDLATASNMVAKAASGNTDAFGRYGIRIQKTGDQAKDFGLVLDSIQGKFGGRALSELNTYAGVKQGLANSFGDIKEKIGDLLTQNPAYIKALNEQKKTYDQINKILDENKLVLMELATGAYVAFVESTSLLAQAVLSAGRAFLTFNNWIKQTAFGLALQNNAFKELRAEAQALTKQIETGTAIDRKATEERIKFIYDLIDAEKNSKSSSQEVYESQIASIDKIKASIGSYVQSIRNARAETNQVFLGAAQGATEEAATVEAAASKIGFSLVKVQDASTSFNLNSIGVGIAEASSALLEGENAFAAFANSVINSFGDFLIALGQKAVLVGIGAEAVKAAIGSLQGGAAIAAGIALIAAGSAFKKLAGGPKGSGSVSAPSASGSAGTSGAETRNQTAPEREREINLNLVVEGRLDRNGLGFELVDAINRTSKSSGVKINQRAFA